MLAVKEPLGRLAVFAHKYTAEKKHKSKLVFTSVADLLDIIKYRLNKQTIDKVANDLLDKMFAVRWQIVKWMIENDHNVDSLQNAVHNKIDKINDKGKYSDLQKALSNALTVYQDITSNNPLFARKNGINKWNDGWNSASFSYESLKFLLQLYPSSQNKLLIKWIDTSLLLEMAFIIADLVYYGDLEEEKEGFIAELIQFIQSTIEKYGAYAIALEVWKPTKISLLEEQQITNMEILAAKLELDNGKGKEYTVNELEEWINN